MTLNHKLFHSAQGFTEAAFSYFLIGFAAIGLFLCSQITSLASGSTFTLIDSQFFLIIITTGLIFLGRMLLSAYELAIAEVATDRTEVSWFTMWSILALTTLCTAGIVCTTPGFRDSSHSLSTCSVPGMQVMLAVGGSLHRISTCSFPGMQVVLVSALGVWAPFTCRLGLTDDMQLYLNSGLLSSVQISCFMTPGSSFILTVCESILILLGEMLLSTYELATADVMNTDLTEVREWLIAMWSIVVLMNLCVAGIVCIAPGFGSSLHKLSCSFPSMKVVLVVMALGVWSIAFCRLGLTEVLHLDLSWFPSEPITSLTTPGSSFTLTDCQFLLIITTSLVFIGELVVTNGLATANVVYTRTEVSGHSIVLLVLMNLWVAGIATGFGGSLHSFFTCAFPGMQVIALGVGSIAFCRLVVMTDEVLLHLSYRLTYSTSGSSFMIFRPL